MKETNKRRDFLFYSTAALAAVGVGGAVTGLAQALGPTADQLYSNHLKVDLEGLAEGQQITVLFEGFPVFIRHRTQNEIQQARETPMEDLWDNYNRYGAPNSAQASPRHYASDESRSIDPEGRYVVFFGVCTHRGCVPMGDQAGDFNGWFCPCHSAHFDTSGRTRKGPAPYNMYIPRFDWDGVSIVTLKNSSDPLPMTDEQLDRALYGKA